jgi:hypothetical protein
MDPFRLSTTGERELTGGVGCEVRDAPQPLAILEEVGV